MIAQGQSKTTGYTISLKDSSLTLAIGERDIVAYDLGGRLYSVFKDGRHHRRSLSGGILQKWQTEQGRQRRWLDPDEGDRLIDGAARQLQQLIADLNSPNWIWLTPPDSSARLLDYLSALERAARFDSAAASWDAARFRHVYQPIGILPPDQYLALVLQATQGCSFNSCTFCDLYHQDFAIKTPHEFGQHIAEVRDYLGESLSLRQRSIFLGSANALAVPMPRLKPLFETIAREFDVTQQSVYAFLDGFTGTRKSVDDYRALAQLGLRRVYIGLESGHDPLLEFVRKPSRADEAIETVRALKAAGVNVGVIVLLGLGGDRFTFGHVEDTIAALNAMHLGKGDLIYFSELVEEPGTAYPELAEQASLRPLTADEHQAQQANITAGLHFAAEPPKISNYDVREFVY
jgi:hypothetical protein